MNSSTKCFVHVIQDFFKYSASRCSFSALSNITFFDISEGLHSRVFPKVQVCLSLLPLVGCLAENVLESHSIFCVFWNFEVFVRSTSTIFFNQEVYEIDQCLAHFLVQLGSRYAAQLIYGVGRRGITLEPVIFSRPSNPPSVQVKAYVIVLWATAFG